MLNYRQMLVLGKIESTYGTDSTPIGSDAILATNIQITPLTGDSVSREIERQYHGNKGSIPTNVHSTCSFRVELAGSGTAGTAPAWAPFLMACGFDETLTANTKAVYAPVSEDFSSVTLYWNDDGLQHNITGARGTVTLEISNNAIPYLNFVFTGIYNAPTDTAQVTPVLTGYKKPLIASKNNTAIATLHGVNLSLQSFSYDHANTVAYREMIGGSGVKQAIISDRSPTASIIFDATTVASKNWVEIAKNATEAAFSIQHGSSAGEVIKIDAPKVSLQPTSYSDGASILQVNSTLNVNPNSGDDEISIEVR